MVFFWGGGQDLTELTRLVLNLWSSCLSLLDTGTIGVHYHTSLFRYLKGVHIIRRTSVCVL